MTEFFNRDFQCLIGGAVISCQIPDMITETFQPSLRASFKVEKTSAKEPNKATIEVYNLSESNRSILKDGADIVARTIALAQKAKVAPVWQWPLIVEAGYVGSREQLFTGDVVYAQSKRDTTSWITTIEAEDGGIQFSNARIKQSFGPGTTLQTVLLACAKALGVGIGNSMTKLAAPKRSLVVYKKGLVLSGKVSDVLDKQCTNAGYKWSIQDGQLQLLAKGETLIESVPILSATSGLIGSPELGEAGSIKCQSLLRGTIKPGKRIIVESQLVKGTFKVDRVTHSGDTWGSNWYSEIEAKPV